MEWYGLVVVVVVLVIDVLGIVNLLFVLSAPRFARRGGKKDKSKTKTIHKVAEINAGTVHV